MGPRLGSPTAPATALRSEVGPRQQFAQL